MIAIEIFETAGDPHAVVGLVRLDWCAEKEFKRAFELNPRYATVRQ
ncbi:MAG: hypothetical protein ND895_08370 [Pyrinomonadaceae bacterium]|nr:hypothetical protein [Pyrinomonadaceae bacterium]